MSADQRRLVFLDQKFKLGPLGFVSSAFFSSFYLLSVRFLRRAVEHGAPGEGRAGVLAAAGNETPGPT